jgi:hypothetical protein
MLDLGWDAGSIPAWRIMKMLKKWIWKWKVELGVLVAIVIADVIGSAIIGRATSSSFWFRMGIAIGAIMALFVIRVIMAVKPGKPLGDVSIKK